MNETDTRFTGSIPETYDRLMGPMLFAPYAAELAARARRLGARRVLEIAAGTGIATRALAGALPEAEIEATDLNEAMVSFAASRNPSPRVRWSTADATALPYPDRAFDLAICQFGVMFFPDRGRAFREARRVLSPGGTYLFSVWDGIEQNEITRIVSRALAAMFPQNPPTFMERGPHGHGDCVALERDLRESGFMHVGWEPVALRSRAASARDAAVALCEGTPLRHEILERDPRRLGEAVEAATRALRAALGDGAIEGSMRAFVFTAS
ncbi:MAG TPA: methyltransferase domain-containing protein [Myxococcales bacterium]|nr:methyltransferase domain-containing protein [Myxococcales bacterium]